MFSRRDAVRSAATAVALAALFGPARADGESPGAGLTLRDALARSLEGNPTLAAFSWEVRAAEALALQSGLRPNPTLSVELENVGDSGDYEGFDSAETTLVLAQLIELGGKRGKRRAVGAREVEVAEREYEAARLEVVIETTSAFFDALAAQEHVLLARAQLRRARELFEAIDAGDHSTAQILRSDLEVTNEEIDLRQSRRASHVARVRLATAWGAMEPDFSHLEGDLSAVAAAPEERDLVGRLAENPELARWRAEVAQRRAEIELADSLRIPDVELGLGPRYIHDEPDDADDWVLVAGIDVPIPVFDRNQGGRRESRDRLALSRELQRSAQLRLRWELALAHSGLVSAYEEITALREDAIPTAERAYEATRDAERRGAAPLIDLFDAQRSLFELQTRLVEVLSTYHQRRAELEALIGGPLEPDGEPHE